MIGIEKLKIFEKLIKICLFLSFYNYFVFFQILEIELCCFKVMYRCDKYKFVSLIVCGSVIIIIFEFDNLYNSKGFYLIWIGLCKIELM